MKWIYLVGFDGCPVACYSSAIKAVACVRSMLVTRKFDPCGFTVYRYRAAKDSISVERENISGIVLSHLGYVYESDRNSS